jgi:hypothetical protein
MTRPCGLMLIELTCQSLVSTSQQLHVNITLHFAIDDGAFSYYCTFNDCDNRVQSRNMEHVNTKLWIIFVLLAKTFFTKLYFMSLYSEGRKIVWCYSEFVWISAPSRNGTPSFGRKCKDKRPRTVHEVPEREQRFISALSLTSALDEGGWLTPCPGFFTLGTENLYPVYKRQGRPQGRSGRVRKISPPPGFDERRGSSQSQYRLSYRGLRFFSRPFRNQVVIRLQYTAFTYVLCCLSIMD